MVTENTAPRRGFSSSALPSIGYCVGTGSYTQASSGLMYGSPGCTPEKTTKVRSVSMAPWHLSANLQVDPLGCGNGLARLFDDSTAFKRIHVKHLVFPSDPCGQFCTRSCTLRQTGGAVFMRVGMLEHLVQNQMSRFMSDCKTDKLLKIIGRGERI